MNTSPIIITGAGQRLGLAVAMELSSSGYNVVCSYRTPRKSIELLKQQGIECIQADFNVPDSLQAFIEEIKRRYSSLRGVIHNASEWIPDDAADDHFLIERMLQIHVKVPFLLNQAFRPLLLNYSCNGRMADIIHLTDHSATFGSHTHIAYAASKSALDNMTSSYAKALAPHVKVNSIAPSLLMFNTDDKTAYKESAQQKTLLPPAPGVQEGIDAINYLLNSAYVTGNTMNLNGGRHLATGSINSIIPVNKESVLQTVKQGK